VDFYLRVSAVLATATWLAGWLAGWLGDWLSHSGIVSKRLNLSENFFDHLKAPSLLVSWDPCADTKFHGEPLQRGVKYTGGGKIGDFRV